MFQQTGIIFTGVRDMSKNIHFVLDLAGWNEFCKTEWMHEVLNEHAEQICSGNPDYSYRTHNASFTALTNVYPTTKEAAKDNYANNTLLKMIGG